MNIPQELLYSKDHLWVKMEGETAYLGLTDFAQDELKEIVFVNLPQVGDQMEMEAIFGDVESIKSVSTLFSPVSGTVAAVNEVVLKTPQKINEAPYEVWLLKVDHAVCYDELFNAEQYKAYLETELGDE